MSLKRSTFAALAMAVLAASIPTAALADDMTPPSGHRVSLGVSFQGGSLSSETFNGGAATNCVTLSLSGACQQNISNRLWGISAKYQYIFSGVPIGIGIGLTPMIAGTVTQGGTDERLNNDLSLILIPISISYNFNAGSGLEPYVYLVNNMSAFTSTPKNALAGLPQSGRFNFFSPGGGVGLRWWFDPMWGIDANLEAQSLTLDSTFTGNAATAALSRGRIANGTTYTRTRNGFHLLANLALTAKF